MSQTSRLKQTLQGLRDQPDELIDIILRQAGLIEELQKKIEQLEKQIRDLNDRNDGLGKKVEELEKAAARQAAPFRRRDAQRVAQPKRPGRHKGHRGYYRRVPDHIDEEIQVPLCPCPECGRKVRAKRQIIQYLEEIPPVRPRVIKLVTEEGHCPHCDQTVRSTHPLQVSLAEGAAGVQLGPNALAMAVELNKRHGLTMRKTCAVLEQLFQLKLTAGGLAQAIARLAKKLTPSYEHLLARLRDGPYVHSDETSWWVNGPGYWLWVFATRHGTIYRVAQGRGRNIVLETLGEDYQGTLITDCLSIYDDVNGRQQKCYAHHLKAISHAIQECPSPYLTELKGLLKGAMALKGAGLPAPDFAQHRTALDQQASRLLESPRQGVQEKVRKRLWKQRDHLFTFLDVQEVDATNNLAERQLRPAVIARKVSCGNKTPAGAKAWEVLTSLAATCAQTGESFATLLNNAARLSFAR